MPRILVSAGEASGDLYASLVVAELARRIPTAEFFGCTGPRLRKAGVRTVVDVASLLYQQGIPVVYLVAPQAWAWRKGRIPGMRRTIRRLLCIFPFEEEFFQREGVAATYIGHPLAGLVRPSLSRETFFQKHRLAAERPLVSV